ncbi:acetylcholine receptor subunit beta-like 1 [Caerostris extrusa]|uniref:Acetylcholine receptor subunit beta-like 1 n=1 Tax=Caerostris extrusa TaxID=172846 RepID=A0AAV4XDW5_CAEEX|nr:acetylcholine receptor subunit beta-like 1 [Caerostris extrusa]
MIVTLEILSTDNNLFENSTKIILHSGLNTSRRKRRPPAIHNQAQGHTSSIQKSPQSNFALEYFPATNNLSRLNATRSCLDNNLFENSTKIILHSRVNTSRRKRRPTAIHNQAQVMASEDEERLVRDLFRDYNKLIRPVEVMNKTVEVQFGLSFIQLINVNEKNQIMTSNVWLQLNSDTCPQRRDKGDDGWRHSHIWSREIPLMMDEGRRSGAENTLMRAPTNQVRETTTGNTQMTYAQRKKKEIKSIA